MKHKWKGKLPVVLVLSSVFVLVTLLGNSFSWFTSKDSRINHFDTDGIEFSVGTVDIFEPPDSYSPGDTAPKEVGAINKKDIPAFVRLMVMPSVVSADGQPLEAIPGKQIELIGFNTDQWRYGGDGYYYYLGVLGPTGSGTDKTEPLFTAVKLADVLDDAYIGARMNIVIKTEAVDTKKWHYSFAWWQNHVFPVDSPLIDISTILASKAY